MIVTCMGLYSMSWVPTSATKAEGGEWCSWALNVGSGGGGRSVPNGIIFTLNIALRMFSLLSLIGTLGSIICFFFLTKYFNHGLVHMS